jgi:hypothetical protein
MSSSGSRRAGAPARPRRWVFLTFLLAACLDPASPRSGFDGIYRMTGCTAAESSPPCHVYGSGGTQVYADSGRIEFTEGRTARWMLWTRASSNPCYINGQSCLTTSKEADTVAGTYKVRNDSIVLMLQRNGGTDSSRVLDPSTVDHRPEFLSIDLTAGFDYSRAVFRP